MARLFLFGLMVGLAAPVANAVEFDAAEIKVITPTTATSTCIGDPRTPLCAVETILACSARMDISLCKAAGVEDVPMPVRPFTIQYRVLSVEVLAAEDIPEDRIEIGWLEPGHAEVEILSDAIHDFSFPTGEGTREVGVYVRLKPVSGSWHVIHWWSDGFGCSDYPEGVGCGERGGIGLPQ